MTQTITEKKKISAVVIADSTNPLGHRLTTFVVTFPRIVLAELNTHRMFSRNSASSRAIPFERMLKMVEEDPFIPIAWQKDHKGMQGTEYLTPGTVNYPQVMWLEARNEAVRNATNLSRTEVTKQLCNRLLEPFMWHTAIITATEWENFFSLRCPQYTYTTKHGTITSKSRKDFEKESLKIYGVPPILTDMEWMLTNKGQAEIHIMALAEAMWDARNESTPKQLDHNGWHIPFGDNISADLSRWEGIIDSTEGWGKDLTPLMIKVATARCARVSYMNFEGKDDYKADIKLHDQLLASGHMSPFEHCAQAMPIDVWSGNFRGFKQYRKTISGENRI
jgi:thymidylate synthase ThyX